MTYVYLTSKYSLRGVFFSSRITFSLTEHTDDVSVHGLGKWHAKFRTGKFRPEIAFTICTSQFHLTKNDSEGLRPVSKMALKKWNKDF